MIPYFFCRMPRAMLHSVPLSDPCYDEITGLVRKSYPSACILWIDRIENPGLEGDYLVRKLDVEEKRGNARELRLFHGSSENACMAIANKGFDVDLNTRSAYGVGTYFASPISS